MRPIKAYALHVGSVTLFRSDSVWNLTLNTKAIIPIQHQPLRKAYFGSLEDLFAFSIYLVTISITLRIYSADLSHFEI